jgi:hypothetical protein
MRLELCAQFLYLLQNDITPGNKILLTPDTALVTILELHSLAAYFADGAEVVISHEEITTAIADDTSRRSVSTRSP